MSLDPAEMTIAEASREIQSGALTPSTLTEACLERTAAREPETRAWTYCGGDQSRMAARLLDLKSSSSPLHGIPFGVKDNIDTADMPTELGTPIYQQHRPVRDAACVALLKEAGGVCLGKTVTTELAHFHPGKTRNPHSSEHTPGGSSSGSAAAVADCMVPFALGTQTTGSVLRPASFCGVYGYKPSYGDVNLSGVFENAASFDTVGWFTRSVEDIEIVRRALIRAPAQPFVPAKLSQLRIGFFKDAAWTKVDSATQRLVESAAQQLSSMDAIVTEIVPNEGFNSIAQHHRSIAAYEFARAISWERTHRQHQLSPKLLNERCEDGLACTYETYVHAQESIAEQRAVITKTMQQFDLLLTAAAPGEAWKGLEATGDPLCNTAWTALHMPAISIPAFTGETGLPIGLQLVGGIRRDEQLLAAAESVRVALGLANIRHIRD